MSLELSRVKTRDLASVSYPAVVVRRGSNVDFWRWAVALLLHQLGNGVHCSRGLVSFPFRSVVLSHLFPYPVLEDCIEVEEFFGRARRLSLWDDICDSQGICFEKGFPGRIEGFAPHTS